MMKNRRTTPAKPVTTKAPAEQVVKDIRRATRNLSHPLLTFDIRPDQNRIGHVAGNPVRKAWGGGNHPACKGINLAQ